MSINMNQKHKSYILSEVWQLKGFLFLYRGTKRIPTEISQQQFIDTLKTWTFRSVLIHRKQDNFTTSKQNMLKFLGIKI